jgi:hypothetical protein
MLREGNEGPGTETVTFIRLIVQQGGLQLAGLTWLPLGKSSGAFPLRIHSGFEIGSLGRGEQ